METSDRSLSTRIAIVCVGLLIVVGVINGRGRSSPQNYATQRPAFTRADSDSARRLVDSVGRKYPKEKLSSAPTFDLSRAVSAASVFGASDPTWLAAADAEYKRRNAKTELEQAASLVKAGCPSASRSRIAALLDAHREWGTQLLGAIACRSAQIGMTPDQAIAAWGKPDDINRTTRASGVHEQWVYGHRSYLYFNDGVLTSIQN